ncbi:MAG TPA: hypothetical protein VIV34_12220 [Pseudolabrys sp.]
MKTIAIVFGIALVVVAVIYFLMPADSLPSFFPGHEAGLARIRVKHGLLSGGLGVVLLAGAWIMGRK